MLEIINTSKWFQLIKSDVSNDTERVKKYIDFEVAYSQTYSSKAIRLYVSDVKWTHRHGDTYASLLSEPFADGNFTIILEKLERKNMKRVDVWLNKVMTVRDQIIDLYNAWDYEGVANLVQSL